MDRPLRQASRALMIAVALMAAAMLLIELILTRLFSVLFFVSGEFDICRKV